MRPEKEDWSSDMMPRCHVTSIWMRDEGFLGEGSLSGSDDQVFSLREVYLKVALVPDKSNQSQ